MWATFQVTDILAGADMVIDCLDIRACPIPEFIEVIILPLRDTAPTSSYLMEPVPFPNLDEIYKKKNNTAINAALWQHFFFPFIPIGLYGTHDPK